MTRNLYLLHSITLLLILGIMQVGSELTARPRNVAVVSGGRATIQCATSIHDAGGVKWLLNGYGKASLILYNKLRVNPQYNEIIEVIRTEEGHKVWYNLTLLRVNMDYAGIYNCLDLQYASESAALIVLESEPQCKVSWSNGTDFNTSTDYLPTNDTATITCSVGYRGRHAPALIWQNCSEIQPDTSKTYISSETVSTSVEVKAGRAPLNCSVRLDFSTLYEKQDADPSIPDFHLITSTTINVTYPVSNITIVKEVDKLTSIENNSSIYQQTALLAIADGQPINGIKFFWVITRFDESGNATRRKAVGPVITLDDAGNFDIYCKAENVVWNTQYSTFITVHNITVSGFQSQLRTANIAGIVVIGTVVLTLVLIILFVFCAYHNSPECKRQFTLLKIDMR